MFLLFRLFDIHLYIIVLQLSYFVFYFVFYARFCNIPLLVYEFLVLYIYVEGRRFQMLRDAEGRNVVVQKTAEHSTDNTLTDTTFFLTLQDLFISR